MGLIIGIDTGGTFTDGVLMNYETKEIIRTAKAFTTHENLSIGIGKCIEELNILDCTDVCCTYISTTLATNAVVEGHEMPVGLITIGATEEKEYPAEINHNVSGKIDIMGWEIEPIDENYIKKILSEMKGKIFALAISGYASIRNPKQELAVYSLACSMLNVPVVCAHELTSDLGFYERTVTSVLNAKLIPIINELITDVKKRLHDVGITSPVIVIKGDGKHMVESYAKERPVETVFSGPAASTIGGEYLTGLKDAILVDMGGTTTDIACIENGNIVLTSEGAHIGDWKTRVKAVKASTYALGGDSHIKMIDKFRLAFGPERAVPLCVAANRYPDLIKELEWIKRKLFNAQISKCSIDCFCTMKKRNGQGCFLTEQEKKILQMLSEGPHTALYLSEKLGVDIENLEINRLVKSEQIQLISLTPTDITHVSGECRKWDSSASSLGVEIMAKQLGIDAKKFINSVEAEFTMCICNAILRSFKNNGELKDVDTGKLIFEKNDINKTIIGLGAPASIWIRKAAEYLGTKFLLPDHNIVAGAVGAAVSNVNETLEGLIYFDSCAKQYVSFLPGKKIYYSTLDEAKSESENILRECARLLAEKLSVLTPDIKIFEEDVYTASGNVHKKNYIKTILSASLMGVVDID